MFTRRSLHVNRRFHLHIIAPQTCKLLLQQLFTKHSTILGLDQEPGIYEEVCVDRAQVSVEHSFIPGAQVMVWMPTLWTQFFYFSATLAGYNVLTDSDQLSTQFKENVACDGGTGSSVVFSPQPRAFSTPGCSHIPSNPLDLKTTCGQNQAHQAVQLAFQDRSSFTLGFGVLCEGNQCGSESGGTRLRICFLDIVHENWRSN